MSDWAKRADDKLRQKEEDQKQKDALYLAQRQQYAAETPALWEELKECLFREVTAFDKLRPGYLTMDADYQGASDITVRADQMILEVSFQADKHSIKYRLGYANIGGGSYSGYGFDIKGGKVVFSGHSGHGLSAQQVAEDLLDSLVR